MSNTIDVNSVLNQIRSMRQEINSPLDIQRDIAADRRPDAFGGNTSTEAPSFASMLQNSVETVNSLQKTSGALSEAFVRGDPSVTLPEVMVASQKSSVAFSAAVEVRNKFIEAYQEVMRMSV